jgi:hypothetical protein
MTPSSSLEPEIAALEAQLSRVDTKAALLFGFTGAAIIGGSALVNALDLNPLGNIVALLSVLPLVISAVFLILAVRPVIDESVGASSGFPHYARLAPEQLAQAIDQCRDPEVRIRYLADLSRLAVKKYDRIRRAVDLILTGIGLSAVSCILMLSFN